MYFFPHLLWSQLYITSSEETKLFTTVWNQNREKYLELLGISEYNKCLCFVQVNSYCWGNASVLLLLLLSVLFNC
jgi:hypothetical protein